MTTKRAPDNEPFDFNLDGYVKGMDLTPFRFHFGDRRWEMAHFDGLDSKETKKAAQDGDDEVLKLAMGADQFDEFDELPLPNGASRELVNRYFKHCGVDMGELLGSTGS